ncbi:MAG: ABC transporter substrate-binding protein [Candidatus Krumholzibacteriota bacterium]|nr:ABC transporter substrate-binding protein [Candidatus Krumholzibacteriota bacterium]
MGAPRPARVVAAMAVAAFLCGCGEAPDDSRVLNLALKTAPNRLDPAFVVDVSEGELCALLFQGLVRFSTGGELIPAAARSWNVDEDGRRYTFHLDTRMKFSDGKSVRADDVVYSFTRVLSRSTLSPRRWVLDRIRGADMAAGDSPLGIHASDDSTVVIELTEPFAPFLSMLAMPAAMIVSERGTGEIPAGSGPWQLSRWERADFVSLVPNPYHPARSAQLDEIRFRIIPEAFTRVAEFESGSLDILEVPLAEVRYFVDDEYYSTLLQSRSELRVYYVGLNNTHDILGDVRVRRALNMAVDVERLITVLAGGEGVRATGSVPPGLPGYRPRPAYPYDPGAARALLAQAGYPEGFAMEIWQRDSPEGNRLLEAIQGYLREVGVNVTLVRREWSAFKEAVGAGRVDAFFLDWFADYPDAENFLFPLFHSSNTGGGGNRVSFLDRRVDDLIEGASRSMDPGVSAILYARADSAVYAQAPWIYLYFPRSYHAISQRVRGYQLPTLYLGGDYGNVSKVN